MNYTIEDKLYAFSFLRPEERAGEVHLLDAAADLFMRTMEKISPDAWNRDGEAAGLRAALPEKYYPAVIGGMEEGLGYVRIYYWYDTYVDYDMYEHSQGGELILFEDGTVIDAGRKWYEVMRGVFLEGGYPVGSVGRLNILDEVERERQAEEYAALVNEGRTLKF
ncbi:MAG: hypothetical protein Q4A32_10670 [Lachnospiraceae bacterium]|nr:hypothetical protein [Lachnospiraceae bacterium]